jgi:hypothetical protein
MPIFSPHSVDQKSCNRHRRLAPIRPHGGITIATADESKLLSEPRAPPPVVVGRGKYGTAADLTELICVWLER